MKSQLMPDILGAHGLPGYAYVWVPQPSQFVAAYVDSKSELRV